MRYDEVNQWESANPGKRGGGYNEFKRRKAERLISFLRKKRPDLADNIKSYCVSTPLTLRDYTGTVDGAMYGILRDSNKASRTLVMTRTKLPNLFLTGQNTVLHGLLGVTISAVLTCGELVGFENLLGKIRNA
jgi:all-trans-retinol 13,14-reductase